MADENIGKKGAVEKITPEKVEVIHSFGLSPILRNRVCLLDENAILYPVGKRLAFKKKPTENDLQFFYAKKTKMVSAVAVDWGRTLMAIFFLMGDHDKSVIHVYDLISHRLPHKVQTLVYNPAEDHAATFLQGIFLLDPEVLVAQTSKPDFSLVAYEWKKQRKVFVVPLELELTRMRRHPSEYLEFSTSGPKMMKIWKIKHDELKDDKQVKGIDRTQKFVDHLWYNRFYIILGAECGDVALVKGHEQRELFPKCLGTAEVTTVTKCHSGFLAGGASGYIAIFKERFSVDTTLNTETLNFDIVRLVRPVVDDIQELVSLMPKPRTKSKEEDAVWVPLLVSTTQALYLGKARVPDEGEDDNAPLPHNEDDEDWSVTDPFGSLASQSIYDDDQHTLTTKERGKRYISIREAVGGFHGQAVTWLSVCARKPLVASCMPFSAPSRLNSPKAGKTQLPSPSLAGPSLGISSAPAFEGHPASPAGGTVSVWDYHSCRRVLSHRFRDRAPRTVAMHPSGYHLAISFEETIDFFHIVEEALVPLQQVFTKGRLANPDGKDVLVQMGVNLMEFSYGGHFLAAATGKYLQVYQTYTPGMEQGQVSRFFVYQGHIGNITALCWSLDDQYFYTGGEDGKVYKWAIYDHEKYIEDFHKKATCYQALHVDHYGNLMGVGYSDTEHGGDLLNPKALFKANSQQSASSKSKNVNKSKSAARSRDTIYGGGSSNIDGTPVSPIVRAFHNKFPKEKDSTATTVPKSVANSRLQCDMSGITTTWKQPSTVNSPDAELYFNTGDASRAGSLKSVSRILMWAHTNFGKMKRAVYTFPRGQLQSQLAPEPIEISGDPTALVAMQRSQHNSSLKLVLGMADGSLLTMHKMPGSKDTKKRGSDGTSKNQKSAGDDDIFSVHKDSKAFVPSEITLHDLGITCMVRCPDGLRFLTASADGAIFVLGYGWQDSIKETMPEDGVIIAQRNTIAVAHTQVRELRADLSQARAHAEFQVTNLKTERERAIKEVEQKYESIIADLKGQIAKGIQEHEETSQKYEQILLENSKSHLNAAEELELLYERKLAIENERYEKLHEATDDLVVAAEEDAAEAERDAATREETLNHKLVEQRQEANEELGAMTKYLEYVRSRYEELMNKQDHQHDIEIATLVQKMERRLIQAAQQLEKSQQGAVLLKKKNKQLIRLTEQHDRKVIDLETQLDDETKQRKKLEKRLMYLVEDVKLQTSRATKWESQSGAQAAQIKELEKVRKVITAQLHSTRAVLQPKEGQIAELQKRTVDMEKELALVTKTKDNLQKSLEDKMSMLTHHNMEIHRQQTHLLEKQNCIELILHRLGQVLEDSVIDSSDARRIYVRVKDVLEEFADKKETKKADIDEEVLHAHKERIILLEKDVVRLQQAVKRREKNSIVSGAARREENVQIIEQLNTLRRQNKDLKAKLGFTKDQVKELRIQMRLQNGNKMEETHKQNGPPKTSRDIRTKKPTQRPFTAGMVEPDPLQYGGLPGRQQVSHLQTSLSSVGYDNRPGLSGSHQRAMPRHANIARGPTLSQSSSRLQGLKDMQKLQTAEAKLDLLSSDNENHKKVIKMLLSAIKNMDGKVYKSLRQTLEPSHPDGFDTQRTQRDTAVRDLIHRILDDDYEVWGDHALRDYYPSTDPLENNNLSEIAPRLTSQNLDHSSRPKTVESSLPNL